MTDRRSYDFLVIGSGVAGLSFALKVAPHGSVAIVTKKELAESNTNYAQGGIAAVLGDDDSFALHEQDTLATGGGLSHPGAVTLLVENGPRMIADLVAFGVTFSEGEGGARLDLGREGGHSRRRIAHAKDLTGAEIERALIESCRAEPSITVFENHMAVNLVVESNVVRGAYVMDVKGESISPFAARATLLATGGAGKVYLYTSNPDIASGDGIAMASRAGAKIANMEFMQFHPTCLYHPLEKSFLISEAVRGEGAILKTVEGREFMKEHHALGSLAPRDVVARAIDREIKKGGYDFVYLDTTLIDADYFTKRFPKIYGVCRSLGYDPTVTPLPVAPAAHYLCGGVVTDLQGKTSLDSLFAAGECAHTGVHGANRLASNSLLEAVVFADRAATAAVELVSQNGAGVIDDIPTWETGDARRDDEKVVVSHLWDEIRRLMWNYVGIVRTNERLARAESRLQTLCAEIDDYYWRYAITSDLLELRNLAECARLIVVCARLRKESRGLHYNRDHPDPNDNFLRDTIIQP